jgi:hypothetical protein
VTAGRFANAVGIDVGRVLSHREERRGEIHNRRRIREADDRRRYYGRTDDDFRFPLHCPCVVAF